VTEEHLIDYHSPPPANETEQIDTDHTCHAEPDWEADERDKDDTDV
jgi:hypothetical protein